MLTVIVKQSTKTYMCIISFKGILKENCYSLIKRTDIFPSHKGQMHFESYTFTDRKPGICSETGSIQIEIFNSCHRLYP